MDSKYKDSEFIKVKSKMNANEILHKIKNIFQLQLYGVLATSYRNQPYTYLLAYVASKDMKYIYVATDKTTHKFQNINQNDRVAFFIDTRSNDTFDVNNAYALTTICKAEQINKKETSEVEKLYLSRHPQLETFLSSINVEFLRLTILSFSFVEHFQNVYLLERDIKADTTNFFVKKYR